MYFTYIIFSDSLKRYYTGSTKNLNNRLIEHNSGETKSITNGIPWKIVWTQMSDTRGEAMQLEVKIKKRGAKRFLNDLA